MPRILIAEDDQSTSNEWRRLMINFLSEEENVGAESIEVDQAFNYQDTLDFLDEEEYDITLLDHELDPSTKTLTGLEVLEELQKRNNGKNLIDKKFVVLTGFADSDVARSYERFGCLEQLIKPISEAQFKVAMIRAWTRLRIGEEESDWEDAYDLLSQLGLIQSLESLQRDAEAVDQLHARVTGLQESFEQFKKQFAGKHPEEQLAGYEAARASLSTEKGSVGSVLPHLDGYGVTESFLDDLQHAFRHDRLAFWILQSYLQRFKESDGRVRYLQTGFGNHAEYRIGRSYRLYFRQEGSKKVLEHFGHKNKQGSIIDGLRNGSPTIVNNVDRYFAEI